LTHVFVDASSAILLQKADLFDPLVKLFSPVLAASVFHEISRKGYPGSDVFTLFFRQGLFRVLPATDTLAPAPGPHEMDAGERDTLCLFLERQQGFILTDDGQAARFCHKNTLPFINALLVPKVFWYAGHMTQKQAIDHMTTLCRIGRYTPAIKAFAFDCGLETLSRFLPKPHHA
jgi:predicted nucleic acid-binding protein